MRTLCYQSHMSTVSYKLHQLSDHAISFCMHGVGCISLADKAEVFPISLPKSFCSLVVFNATSQLWFHHMLIMWLSSWKSPKIFPFSSKSWKLFFTKETHNMVYTYAHPQFAKNTDKSFRKWTTLVFENIRVELKIGAPSENCWLGSDHDTCLWASSQKLSATTVFSYLQMRMIFMMWFLQWQALLEGGRTLVAPYDCVQVTWRPSCQPVPTHPVTAWEKCSYCGWDRAIMYVSHSYTYAIPPTYFPSSISNESVN